MIGQGTVLGGRYRLEDRIASGGMGDVWRAVDDVLGRSVAVKVLLPALSDEPGFGERFRGEARTMATINHPGVVDIYDYASDSTVGAYLVMEYVEGDALSRTLNRVGRLTPGRTMALVAQAADALHAAHVMGVVHRDVKPGNLLVRPNGTLVLTDFGIARAAGAAQLTAAGSVLGTASYISPEQAMGQPATPLSDIYALGVVAYQCLAGRRPFEGDNPLEIAMRHVRDTPPPLPPDIPPVVRAIVERAIAKEPGQRWPDAAAFAAVARRAAASLAGAGPAGRTGGMAGQPGMPPATGLTKPTGSPVSGGTPIPTGTTGRPGVVMGGAGPGGRPPYVGPGAPGGPRPGGATAPGRYPPGAAGVPPQPGIRQEYLTGPVPGSSRVGLVVAIVVAVIVVAICVGTVIAIAKNKTNSSGPSDTRIALTLEDCERAHGKQFALIRSQLEGRNLRVTRADAVSELARNRVEEIVPCPAAPGSEVTVKVSTGKNATGGAGQQPCVSASGSPVTGCPESPKG
jgi:serine/threonine-protein kinase